MNQADEIAEVFSEEVPDKLKAFGNNAKQFHMLPYTDEHGVLPPRSVTIHF